MSQCVNCNSRFFKTLETRMLVETFTGGGSGMLLMKKRCKRCKHKFFFSKEIPSGKTAGIPYTLWLEGVRIPNLTGQIPGRFRIFAGEFSHKIRRCAEDVIAYHDRLEKVVATSATRQTRVSAETSPRKQAAHG